MSRSYAYTFIAVFGVVMGISADIVAASDYLPVSSESWQLVTDDVMGGVSTGKIERIKRDNKECVALSGDVSTENNGGFIQIAMDIDESLAAKAAAYDGVRIGVIGNDEPYNLHLRTKDLWFPWQAYRSTFDSSVEWKQIDLPFEEFTAYKTSTRLDVSQLRRVGIVAIGREFAADVCVANIGFYRI
jgi:hypothetical protein